MIRRAGDVSRPRQLPAPSRDITLKCSHQRAGAVSPAQNPACEPLLEHRRWAPKYRGTAGEESSQVLWRPVPRPIGCPRPKERDPGFRLRPAPRTSRSSPPPPYATFPKTAMSFSRRGDDIRRMTAANPNPPKPSNPKPRSSLHTFHRRGPEIAILGRDGAYTEAGDQSSPWGAAALSRSAAWSTRTNPW